MYKLVKNYRNGEIDTVIKIEESKVICIPFDPANSDFIEYNKWLSEGNQPLLPNAEENL